MRTWKLEKGDVQVDGVYGLFAKWICEYDVQAKKQRSKEAKKQSEIRRSKRIASEDVGE